MHIERRILLKWTGTTLFCGLHSFFWGVVSGSSIVGMLAGLLTLILMFSLIDSHPRFRAARAANTAFSRALDIGVRIRIYLAAYIIVSYSFSLTGLRSIPWLMLPQMAEISVGMYAQWLVSYAPGSSRGALRRGAEVDFNMMNGMLGSFSTTLLTGLAHTAILAVICLLVYGALKLVKPRPAA